MAEQNPNEMGVNAAQDGDVNGVQRSRCMT